MAIDLGDEILQDFLVEAGEIIEQLGEQLVELERRPTDRDLLNAVFRGFHTIKGGAGFVNLTPLVNVCHRAEDVFNVLRQGERPVDADLMDAVLQVVDIVNQMFQSVKRGVEPESAHPRLLARLENLAKPQEGGAAAPQAVETPTTGPAAELITDGAAAAADGTDAAPQQGPGGSMDEISDVEFEALLDQLHGPGKHGGVPGAGVEPPAAGGAPQGQPGDITDEEFEALLNQLHGPQGAPSGIAAPAARPAAAGAANDAAHPAPPAPGAEPAGHDAAEGPDKDKAAGKDAHHETTIRVDTKRLDDIMNLVGELVLVRNRLATLRANVSDEEVDKAVSSLDLVTADLQVAAMKTRMQPIKKVFGRFPRVVRDIARALKKEVNLELIGEETDLDKNLVEALSDPLVHLVRNAVDHGIEEPGVRQAAGKPRTGTIVLAAMHAGDHIQLSIEDDGGGMDAAAIRRKAVEKGLIDADIAARMDERESLSLIFLPGLSTKEQISDVSGRGVGMDVVKNRISQLNGSIEIDSAKGKGTTILIRVPLTLAILPTLMVVLGERIFALPLSNVNEIFDLDIEQTKVVDGQEVVLIRNSALPIFHLHRWTHQGPGRAPLPKNGHVVVVSIGNQYVGLVVDKLVGQEEVVIKPLGSLLRGTKGLAGATITGDGRIALILDIPSLLSRFARKR